MESAENEDKKDLIPLKVRRSAAWISVGGAIIYSAVIIVFIVIHTFFTPPEENWVIPIIREHFAALIGLPFAAVTALFIVVLLKITSRENIAFEVLGFKFRGASGPVVLWLMCFLGIAFALWLLW